MKVAGVIAEYNPFHNGHKYQLEEIRRRTGADYIIAAMSGDFVQRGTPAILDKYTRAEMALREGADLVLELPFLYATASAEMFALGGVSLLKNTGITDYLCFGAETDNLPLLQRIAAILSDEPTAYREILRSALSCGLSYPAAREKALLAEMVDFSGHADSSGREHFYSSADTHDSANLLLLREVLHGSNNLLALEYLKQLNRSDPDNCNFPSSMTPLLIQRIGDAYNNREVSTAFASATAIRQLLRPVPDSRATENSRDAAARDEIEPVPQDAAACGPEQHSMPDRHAGNFSGMQTVHHPGPGLLEILPGSCILPILMARKQNTLLFEDSLSLPLACRLVAARYSPYRQIADCSSELYQRILNLSGQFQNYSDFCLAVKNKSVTYSHVSHALLNLLFEVTKEEYEKARELGAPYLHVLGFRRQAAPLLSILKRESIVPVLMSAADYKSLEQDAEAIFRRDLYASDYHNQLVRMQSGVSIKNDFSHPMVII